MTGGTRTGLRLLATVTLNPNQLRAHLEPITDLPEVEHVTLVSDRRGPAMTKLRTVVPPVWLTRIAGRAAGKFAVMLVLAVRERPDLLLGYNLVPHALTALGIGRITRTRVLIHLIGGPREWEGGGWTSDNRVLGRLRRPVRMIESALVRCIAAADVVAVMGTRGRADLIALGVDARRVHALPAAVDVERLRRRRGVPRYDICTAAQLIPRKRVEDLIDAAALLRESRPALRVAIAGRGRLEPALRARAAASGLAGTIDFLGFVDDVAELYAQSRLFVLTSRSEGLSIAVLEAMASGTPVIATDVGEIRDAIEEGVEGLLYRPGDVAGLAARIDALLADPERRAALAAAAAVKAPAVAGRDRIARRSRALLMGRNGPAAASNGDGLGNTDAS